MDPCMFDLYVFLSRTGLPFDFASLGQRASRILDEQRPGRKGAAPRSCGKLWSCPYENLRSKGISQPTKQQKGVQKALFMPHWHLQLLWNDIAVTLIHMSPIVCLHLFSVHSPCHAVQYNRPAPKNVQASRLPGQRSGGSGEQICLEPMLWRGNRHKVMSLGGG